LSFRQPGTAQGDAFVTTGLSGDARQGIVARRRHEITGEAQGEPKAAAWVAGTTGLPMYAARQTAAERAC